MNILFEELPSIAAHAKLHGIVAKKSYSQNFLFDISICRKIASYLGNIRDKNVVEIGPGVGGLTRAILEMDPKGFLCIEKDNRCKNLIDDLHIFYPKIHCIIGDALELELNQVSFANSGLESNSRPNKKFVIISNLPYEISVVLLFKWLNDLSLIDSMVLMFQKEVADRICAVPSTKAYGKISVIAQLLCDVKKCFDLNPKVFVPPPKIWSTVLHFTPKSCLMSDMQMSCLSKVVGAAFSMRRKMLKTSLKSAIPNADECLKEIGLDSSARAEDLSPLEYLSIVNLCLKSK